MEFKTFSSTFGKTLCLRIWGGSHEPYVGADILGFPEGQTLDFAKLQRFMARRSPAKNKIGSSARTEADTVIFTDGLNDFATTGEKISLKIKNQDIDAKPYLTCADIPRPGHADYPAKIKYKDSINLSGGGPFSARMTAPLCAAGGIALQFLEKKGIHIAGRIYRVGDIKDSEIDYLYPDFSKLETSRQNILPCLDQNKAELMQAAILKASEENDSLGSVIEAFIFGLPAGIGSPMYQGIESVISPILFGIPAVKAVSFGSGTHASEMRGSTHNDPFAFANGKVVTTSNNHGGILGGISTGMPIYCKVYFKPTSSIGLTQNSVNLKTGENCTLTLEGRHDSCIGVRAVPIVEAALALGICDILLTEEKNVSVMSDDEKTLENMRKSIDFVDQRLAEYLLYRCELVSQIGEFKKTHSIPIADCKREEYIKESIKKLVHSTWDIDKVLKTEAISYIGDIFDSIIEKSREIQNQNE